MSVLSTDSRHCTDCSDVRELSVHIENLHKRLDDLTTRVEHGLEKMFSLQNENYETIRRRFHEVVNDMHRGIQSESLRSQEGRDNLEDKINDLERGHHLMQKDIENINATLMKNAETRADNHKSLMDSLERVHNRMDKFDEGLANHMREEDALKRRLLIWIIILFGSGLIGYTIYVWERLGVNP